MSACWSPKCEQVVGPQHSEPNTRVAFLKQEHALCLASALLSLDGVGSAPPEWAQRRLIGFHRSILGLLCNAGSSCWCGGNAAAWNPWQRRQQQELQHGNRRSSGRLLPNHRACSRQQCWGGVTAATAGAKLPRQWLQQPPRQSLLRQHHSSRRSCASSLQPARCMAWQWRPW